MCRCKAFCDGKCSMSDEPSKPQFKKGDKVYSLAHGPGEVHTIESHGYEQVGVYFTGMNKCAFYNQDGQLAYSFGPTCLFHEQPTVIPPKKKVQRWKWAYSGRRLVQGQELSDNVVARVTNLSYTREELVKILATDIDFMWIEYFPLPATLRETNE